MKRVFDDPNHPAYGPARRVWIMLAGLDLLAEGTDQAYRDNYGVAWDECMAQSYTAGTLSEVNLARLIVGRMIRIGRIGL